MLNREKIEVYEKELSSLLEIIAQRLFDSPVFDGLLINKSNIRKQSQMMFEGTMYVLRNSNEKKEGFEPFKVIVTDKRITKQGIWIKIWVGEQFAESELSEIFGS